MEQREPLATWQVQEGAMVAPSLDPDKVAAELASLNVVAEIDWYPATPHLLGLNVVVNASGGLAALDDADGAYRVGATVDEVARHLARTFHAEVQIGDTQVNEIAAGASFPDVTDEEETIRAVEITSMPRSSVPFCAALEGRSVGCLELEGGQRAVFYELPSQDFVEGAMMTHTPAVGFFVAPSDAKLVAVLTAGEAAAESLAIHSWTMRTRYIAGAISPISPQLEERVRETLGHLENPRKVAEIVTHADADALESAFAVTGRDGVIEAMRALGVPTDVASYLYGHLDLEDVPQAVVYHKPGWRDAIGTHFDIRMHDERDDHSPLMSFYRRNYLDRPWVGRGLALAEAGLGAALTVTCAKAGAQRSGWHKIAGTLGAVLLTDAVAETTLATYLGQRLRRYRGEQSEVTQDRDS